MDYESVRESFFEYISGDDIITEKASLQPRIQKTLNILEKNKKKVAFIIAGLTALSATILVLRKRQLEDDKLRNEELSSIAKEIDVLRKEAQQARETLFKYNKDAKEYFKKSNQAADLMQKIDTSSEELNKAYKMSDVYTKAYYTAEDNIAKWEHKVSELNAKIIKMKIEYDDCKNKIGKYKKMG